MAISRNNFLNPSNLRGLDLNNSENTKLEYAINLKQFEPSNIKNLRDFNISDWRLVIQYYNPSIVNYNQLASIFTKSLFSRMVLDYLYHGSFTDNMTYILAHCMKEEVQDWLTQPSSDEEQLKFILELGEVLKTIYIDSKRIERFIKSKGNFAEDIQQKKRKSLLEPAKARVQRLLKALESINEDDLDL